jgi:hypothetical protein
MPSLKLTEKDREYLRELSITMPEDAVAVAAAPRPAYPSPIGASPIEAARRAAVEIEYGDLATILCERDAAVLGARRWRCAFAFLAGVTLAASFAALALWG